jgi:hypothetical protein
MTIVWAERERRSMLDRTTAVSFRGGEDGEKQYVGRGPEGCVVRCCCKYKITQSKAPTE